MLSRGTMAPSAFETILCLTTRMSPALGVTLLAFNAAISFWARESPGRISSASGIGMMRSSAAIEAGMIAKGPCWQHRPASGLAAELFRELDQRTNGYS